MHISGKEGEVIKTQQFNSRSQPVGQPASRAVTSNNTSPIEYGAARNNCVVRSRANKAILRSARKTARSRSALGLEQTKWMI